ncbi:MAG: biotin--[acetyl-CoA-carboxylase] ligase [Spirochaetes bacterium GWD1_27_9]|nr:MAG: biotin--[acetyl-CoA-carboxylase] ligase [Spirochaetes bacterium GWB1_27_13]OHD20240.1 MAG: biotin--[acetyl-CoA-carboxylase] ligase [Spirochaetes bacterium GWC1_27_15]OHD42614.1 MAG: biotin--[acetyl-CoA-carboxylase] ligase [Spirochaetes bacterium GWD1_27_9]
MSLFNIVYLEEVDSTNSFLKQNEFEDKTIVYSFNQTTGRGRENRKWFCFENKNLALSILFKPKKSILNFNWYIACISVALVELFDEIGVHNSWIKWPNDIYINDEKISGVLAESIWKTTKMEKLIVGIGVNVNSTKEDLSGVGKKATSVSMILGKDFDLKKFSELYLDKLSKYFTIFFGYDGIKKIKKEWVKYSKIIGKKVEWIMNGEVKSGEVFDIDEDGILKLKIDEQIIDVLAGDVNLI